MRLPTAANYQWTHIRQAETPVVGGIYNQYIIEYCAPATNEGTQFVGHRGLSHTTHVFWVKNDTDLIAAWKEALDKAGLSEMVESAYKVAKPYEVISITNEEVVDRKRLGEIVFNSRHQMDKLTDITWKFMQIEIDKFLEVNKEKKIVLDWLLLTKTKTYEKNIYFSDDCVVPLRRDDGEGTALASAYSLNRQRNVRVLHCELS